MSISCLIVDDEPEARELIIKYVSDVSFLELKGVCSNAFEAIDILQQEDVDLIISDIQMPKINGLEFIKSLKNPPFIIFITAYPNYAVEGFEINAVDYLVKPTSFNRFFKAVNKAESMIKSRMPNPVAMEKRLKNIFLKDGFKLLRVPVDQIVYVEGLRDYVQIMLPDKKVISYMRMKNMEAMLPADQFIRIHKSFIINIEYIKAIKGNMIETTAQVEIPIGTQYKEHLLKIIGM
jgi:two-component system LytT family response regulator